MATLEPDGLVQLLEGLSVTTSSSDFTNVDVLANPLDVCRIILAEILSTIAGCDREDALRAIQWPNNIFNGDLSVTLPRLRPGCKPNELSSEIVDKVGTHASKPSLS